MYKRHFCENSTHRVSHKREETSMSGLSMAASTPIVGVIDKVFCIDCHVTGGSNPGFLNFPFLHSYCGILQIKV